TFDIDANGLVNVSAKDKATGKEQSIRITSSSGLSQEEVDRMKREAQEHAGEDKKKKEEIDLNNQADHLVFQTEKQLKEFGDKLKPDVKGKVETAKESLKEAMKSKNSSTISSAIEALNSAWSEASSQMYEQATAEDQRAGAGPEQQHGAPADSGESEGKKVEDADYEVVDDKDKDKKEEK
ncbi:MAG: Hsp70 family protein, partial [Bacteroidetes bacterium]|nr:Hsp70 family protein [Bacteroidota bacterium]